MPQLAPFANIAATLIASLLTGAFGFFTARLTARVQQQANRGNENDRAWKRADKGDADADHWRSEWSHEFEKRVKLEAEIVVLKATVERLENELSGRPT